jgi:hypothetical protein
MKTRKMTLSNLLQAVETILDSESQKRLPDQRRLRLALAFTRSVQRTLFGARFVQERTIRRLWASYAYPSMTNYNKWKKQRTLDGNMRLTEVEAA